MTSTFTMPRDLDFRCPECGKSHRQDDAAERDSEGYRVCGMLRYGWDGESVRIEASEPAGAILTIERGT